MLADVGAQCIALRARKTVDVRCVSRNPDPYTYIYIYIYIYIYDFIK